MCNPFGSIYHVWYDGDGMQSSILRKIFNKRHAHAMQPPSQPPLTPLLPQHNSYIILPPPPTFSTFPPSTALRQPTTRNSTLPRLSLWSSSLPAQALRPVRVVVARLLHLLFVLLCDRGLQLAGRFGAGLEFAGFGAHDVCCEGAKDGMGVDVSRCVSMGVGEQGHGCEGAVG
jgi:hypothetical protein